MANMRTTLAFLSAWITVCLGVLAATAGDAMIRGDEVQVVFGVLIAIHGVPLTLVAILVAFFLYRIARQYDAVTRRVAVAAGALVGAVMAGLLGIPALPIWAATCIGGAAGLVWFSVARAGRQCAPIVAAAPPIPADPLHRAGGSPRR